MMISIQPRKHTPQGWSNQDTHSSKVLNQHHHSFRLGHFSKQLIAAVMLSLGYWGQISPSVASPIATPKAAHTTQNLAQAETPSAPNNNSIDISPEIINGSPVLQKWLKGIPDVLSDIKTDPSFRTRVKVGYSQYPSTNQAGGFHAAVDDVFFGRSGLSASANYNSSSTGKRTAYGADLQYYLLALGNYLNVTPLVGFRHLETDKYNRDGLNLGLKLMIAPARGGGADVAISQSWVGFGSATETGLTTISVGYALTENFRLSTDIQQQNAKENYDSRIGFGVEWMP
jgi:hypothetical protein